MKKVIYKKKFNEASESISVDQVKDILSKYMKVGWIQTNSKNLWVNWNLKDGFSVFNDRSYSIDVRSMSGSHNQYKIQLKEVKEINYNIHSNQIGFMFRNGDITTITIY